MDNTELLDQIGEDELRGLLPKGWTKIAEDELNG